MLGSRKTRRSGVIRKPQIRFMENKPIWGRPIKPHADSLHKNPIRGYQVDRSDTKTVIQMICRDFRVRGRGRQGGLGEEIIIFLLLSPTKICGVQSRRAHKTYISPLPGEIKECVPRRRRRVLQIYKSPEKRWLPNVSHISEKYYSFLRADLHNSQIKRTSQRFMDRCKAMMRWDVKSFGAVCPQYGCQTPTILYLKNGYRNSYDSFFLQPKISICYLQFLIFNQQYSVV